eukprot:711259-Pyramimonas_sp.AAC.1
MPRVSTLTGARNTLVVDYCEARKVKDCVGNCLVISEYTERDLDKPAEQETTLKTLLEYLCDMVLPKTMQSDAECTIPQILREFPYAESVGRILTSSNHCFG